MERLGSDNTQFYRQNAQSHARSFVMDLKLADGTIQIYEKLSRKVVGSDTVFNADFYEDLYSSVVSDSGLSTYPVETTKSVENEKLCSVLPVL